MLEVHRIKEGDINSVKSDLRALWMTQERKQVEKHTTLRALNNAS